MWKKTIDITSCRSFLNASIPLTTQQSRSINNAEIAPRYRIAPKAGWFRRRGSRLTYPTSNPKLLRKVGVDLTLQERLDKLFAEEQAEEADKRQDIGFPPQSSPSKNPKEYAEWKRNQRNNRALEKAARTGKLDVSMDQVNAEHEANGGFFNELMMASENYGIFQDLFNGAYFCPILKLDIRYQDEEFSTPVCRGNVVKPKEASQEPIVGFDSDSTESLWTLILTNPDGHLTDSSAEYLHWMITNIPGNDVSSGQVTVPYLQPFPAFGTGYHRLVFLLFKQKGTLDLSRYCQGAAEVNLAQRTFKTAEFFAEFKDQVTPASLAFFQSDYDSSLTSFFHNVLNMKEPRFEYDFPPTYSSPWLEKNPR